MMDKSIGEKMSTNSRRVNTFRNTIVRVIPKIPNTREVKCELEEMALVDLLMAYLNWKIRSIAKRPRIVLRSEVLADESNYNEHALGIKTLLDAVKNGEDLFPFLSNLVQTQGYHSSLHGNSAANIGWEYKDFLLNAYGVHHFHLGTNPDNNRSDVVLFAQVAREEFSIIGLFSHDVFRDAQTSEREHFFNAINNVFSLNSNEVFFGGGLGDLGITTAGTPTIITQMAIRHAKLIETIDPSLDDSLFLEKNFPQSRYPKLAWQYNHTDLGLLDKKSQTFHIFDKELT